MARDRTLTLRWRRGFCPTARRLRLVADRGKVRLPANMRGVSVECPECGAARLIPLTFPVYQRRAGPEVVYRRPVRQLRRVWRAALRSSGRSSAHAKRDDDTKLRLVHQPMLAVGAGQKASTSLSPLK